MAWRRDGEPAVLVSRAIDETGEVQPSRDEFLAEKGSQVSYHNNAVQAWRVGAGGGVTNVYV
ncbi:MAG: sulfite dehydrogenase, partial [Gammaproteobacteria bacterium]